MVAHQVVADDRLLRALAEQIKLPLVQIARLSELGKADDATVKSILGAADMAIQLIDGFLLSSDVHAQRSLLLEPVSIASVLQAATEDLQQHARNYQCDVELHLSGRYGPIMGNFEALRTAFTTLGYALIESQNREMPRRIVLAAHRTAKGIAAGVFGEQTEVSADMFKRARALYGSARQPLVSDSSSSAAGVFIADSLLSVLATPLQVAHHNKLAGLATTLLPSQQLKLV